MKKFLTVLLALSVVFTYTVGTAFAVSADDPDSGDYVLTEAQVMQKINDAYDLALKDLASEKDAALVTIFPAGKTTAEITVGLDKIVVTKAAVESVYADIYDAAVEKAEANKAAAINAVSANIKIVNDNAAANISAKSYNGNFTFAAGYAEDASWKNAGYAEYKTAWENKATYLNGITKYLSSDYSVLFNTNGTGSENDAVAKAVFAATKKAALEDIQAIDLSVYSKTYNDTAKSNYDLALADKTKAINEISAMTATTWATAATQITAIDSIYTAPVNQGNAKGYLYAGGNGYTGLDNISKIADEPTEAQKLEWAKNKVLDELLASLNTELKATKDALNNEILTETLKGANADQKVINKAKEDLVAAEEAAAAATETIKYLVENTDDYKNLITVNASKFTLSSTDTSKWSYTDANNDDNILNDTVIAAGNTYTMSKFVEISKHVTDLKERAEILKKTENIDGATIVEIEKALEKAIDETYKGNTSASINAVTALSSIYNRQVELIGKTATDVKVNSKIYPTVEAWTDNLARDYDTQYYAEVRQIVADTEAAIKATSSIADAEAAFIAGYEKLQAVPTKSDKATAQATKEFKDLYDEYANDIEKYADYKDGLIEASDYSWTKSIMVGKLKAQLADAYTVDELKATYADAKAEIDNLKTKAELKTAAADLLKRINALPKVATVADKAIVEALSADVTAHNDYCDLIDDTTNKVVLKSALDNAEKNIKDAEAKAIKDQYDAIYKDNKVTTDEADAVKALRTAYDEFVAYYSDPEAIAIVEPAGVSGTAVTNAEKALDSAFVKAFNDMVAQLPADGSDVAGIKAARAAYDALSDYAKYGLGAYQGAAYDKLVDLEKNLVKAVEALKITASSKAVKGKITVKWKVKGDASVADGFQVYKSTKAQKNYKFMGKTKKTSMVNKKGIKKGTRYFYKVRAYKVVDGVKYYSDWSNKANRIAK